MENNSNSLPFHAFDEWRISSAPVEYEIWFEFYIIAFARMWSQEQVNIKVVMRWFHGFDFSIMCPSMYLGTQPLSPQEILKLKYLSDTLNVVKHDIVSISPIDQSSPRCHCDNSCDWQNQITGRMIDVTCMKGKSSSSIRSEFRVPPQRFRILGSQLSAFQPSTSFSQTILLELETSKLYYQAVFLPSTLSSFSSQNDPHPTRHDLNTRPSPTKPHQTTNQ